MSYFPFFENIDDKNFLVVGGGKIAAEKVARLRAFTDCITVVAGETAITDAAATSWMIRSNAVLFFLRSSKREI